MKLWLPLALVIALFTTGCTPTYYLDLEGTIEKQKKVIEEQKKVIDSFTKKKRKISRYKRKYKKTTLSTTKKNTNAKVTTKKETISTINTTATKKTTVFKKKTKKRVNRNKSLMPLKKNIKLKKVEDSNYSSDYMYPTKKTNKTSSSTTVTMMNKDECISLIGPEKFAKYTQMLGSEAASLKRCTMLRGMKN